MFFEDFSNPKCINNTEKWTFPHISNNFYEEENHYESRLLNINQGNTQRFILEVTPNILKKDLIDKVTIFLTDLKGNETSVSIKEETKNVENYYELLKPNNFSEYLYYKIIVKSNINTLAVYGL